MSTTPFATLFVRLQAHLKTQVPDLRWIDQDFGQLEQERPPVSYPCALIDFTDWNFENWGENIQSAAGAVVIRLAFDAWSNTNNLTPSLWKDKGLVFYDIEYKIYKALQGWKPDNYGYLLRESVATEQREDNLRVRVLRFSCSFEDYGASPEYIQTELPPLEITDL